MPTLYAVRRPDGTWTGDSLAHALGRCKPGTSWEITIKRIAPEKSSNQVRWYRGVILPMIAQHIGDDDDSVHEDLLEKFSSRKVRGVDKRYTIDVKKRTRNMTTAEMTEFCEKVRVWAAKFLGLNIPDPIS